MAEGTGAEVRKLPPPFKLPRLDEGAGTMAGLVVALPLAATPAPLLLNEPLLRSALPTTVGGIGMGDIMGDTERLPSETSEGDANPPSGEAVDEAG